MDQIPLDSDDPRDPDYRPKVAIIGGGIAGAAAAFTLEELSLDIRAPPLITMFEQEPIIGGRVASAAAHDEPYQRVETGAPFFSSDDWCISNLIANVGLKIQPYEEDFGQDTGTWDGQTFSNRERGYLYPKTWSDYFRSIWRYGYSLRRLQSLVDKTSSAFASMSPHMGIFRNMTQSLAKYDLLEAATKPADVYLANVLGSNNKLIKEVLTPLARAKLMADLDEVSALEMLKALAPVDTQRVIGGNSRLLNRLIRLSEADVETHARVSKIRQATAGGWLVDYHDKSVTPASKHLGFDFVILTPSLLQSGIEIELASAAESNFQGEGGESVERHVTYFTSEHRFSPEAFAQPAAEDNTVPINVLTDEEGAGEFGIYSMTVPYTVLPADTGDVVDRMEYLYRIVSARSIPDEEIARLFGKRSSSKGSSEIPGVTWIYRRTWGSSFEKFSGQAPLQDLQLVRGLYYTAASDAFMSSLEMSTRMGVNAALDLFYSRLIPDEMIP